MKKVLFLIVVLQLLLVCSCKTYVPPSPPVDDPTELSSYKLGEYGDYVKYVDESQADLSLEEAYSKLEEEVKSPKDGIFESKYSQGLLDFFNIENKIKLTIDISEEELELLNQDYELGNKESYRICNLEITMGNLLFHYEEVGIRQKGNTSRGAVLDSDGNINLRHYKLSFTATFDDEFRENPKKWTDEQALAYRDERNFFGIEKLNIRWNRNQEKTYLREYYAYEMYRANGVLAPRTNPMQVEMKIGDDLQNLGIYLAVEDIDKSFIKRNLVKASAGGDLYKLGWTNVGAKLNSTDSYLFGVEKQVKENGKFKEISYPYDLKTNKKTSTHEDIKSFINKICQTSTSDFNTFLQKDSIYDSVIHYFAISYLLGDPDDLRGNFNNTYLYFTKDTHQALFIPTDHDRALGSTGSSGNNPTHHYGTLSKPFDKETGYSKNDMPLFTKSIFEGGNTEVRSAYMEAIQNIIDGKWMDIDTYKKFYNTAKNNYDALTELGDKVSGKKISFSLLEQNDITKEGNLSIEVYFNTKKKTFLEYPWNPEEDAEVNYSNFYLRGQMNDWNGIEVGYCLKFVDDIPTIEVVLNQGQEFKIADSSWSKELNYDNLVDKALFDSAGGNKNISAKETGTYMIQVVDYPTASKLVITKK